LPVDFPSALRAHQAMGMTKPNEHFDVLIVGAGLSGIGAGYHLQH
jgi:ribulose 1,5-bisphosphate synthetase/thiazole synthase